MAIHSKQRVFLAWMAFILYAAILSTGTHIPSDSTEPSHYPDKLLHFSAFSGFAFLLVHAVNVSRQKPTFYCSIFLLPAIAIYAALDELLQNLVPGRCADFWDWLADICGAGAGLALYGAIFLLATKFRQQSQANI